MEISVQDGIPMGLKRQCVEFARRWLYLNKGLIYTDVDIAADIWDKIDHYLQVVGCRELPVINFVNGSASIPETADLIVYSEKYQDTGHVAVVTDVDEPSGLVHVAEQNYCNRYQAEGDRRSISMIRRENKYWLLDSYLIGWKRVSGIDE